MELQNNITDQDIYELSSIAFEGKVYHEMRAGFYDKIDKIVSGLILISGTAEYYKFVEGKWLDPYLKLIFVVLAISQLTLLFSRKLSLHETLKTKYADLQARFKSLKTENDEKTRVIKHNIYRDDLLNLTKDEPKSMMALRVVARNRVVNSIYTGLQKEEQLIELTFMQKALAQFWSYDTLDLKINADKGNKKYEETITFGGVSAG